MSRETTADEARAALDDLRSSIASLSPEEEEAIADWERSIKKNELWETWNNHPLTKQIYDEMVRRVAEISITLSTEEGMDGAVRHDIFMQKKVYKWMMLLFKKGTDASAFGRIESDVRDALKKYEDYNTNH